MRGFLLSLLLLSVGCGLYAQEPVRFGNREVYLEANVRPEVRGRKTSSLELGTPTGDRLNVLVQFESNKIADEVLAQKNVELGDYLGANAYYASVAPGSHPSDFVGTGIRTVVPIRSEWKIISSLLEGRIPDWAVDGDKLKIDLIWSKGVNVELVKADLKRRGLTFSVTSDLLRTAHLRATRDEALALAEAEYVISVRFAEPPKTFLNYRGARLSGATNLRQLPDLGGRGLTGKGVRIGVWDGNVAEHVDYGNRVHRQEFEMSLAASGGHGMHTTGTILGAGIIDARARGMAPEAEAWVWNFGDESNGKSVGQEMLESYEKYNISLTSNSYGFRMSNFCSNEELLNYSYFGPRASDILAYYIPTLTHCYSAGNDQGVCDWAYGHMSNYAKNVITVAALTAGGAISDFSSFGPLMDGRTAPIIAARGQTVYSVMPGQGYAPMSGTSMSCPTVTGHLALLTERWQQLHGGALPYNYYLKALIANTADDAGNVGPDYRFGFGVLNSLAAVTAMENNWHHFATLQRGGDPQSKTITVPADVKALRVMICWNDPVANKEYGTGQSPMVNDLDLTVNKGNDTYFPYSLEPAEPEKLAVANKKNGRDNIEQVVVKNPVAGEYTITVAGKVNQETKQDYVVVWYFDYQLPTITSPMAGDCYEPSEEIFLHTENLMADLQVELSTDGGKTFSVLKESASACDSIPLPATVVSTDKATIRVTDANHQVVQMTGFFSIMGQVHGLKLEENACSTSGWKLTWNAVPDAAKYEILRADVANGTFKSVKVTDNPTTEYVLEPDAVQINERNVYAVRAINASGVKGNRSIAVIAKGASPFTLDIASLPYLETFIGFPFKHATLTSGENLGHQPQEPPVGYELPMDSHMLVWQAAKAAPDWTDPFSQRTNVGTLSTCSIKLPAVPADSKLLLSVYYYMTQSKIENGTLLRLLVNNVETKDILGRAHIVGNADEHYATFDLSSHAGKEVDLSFETALGAHQDGCIIVYYQIYLTEPRKDVGIAWVNVPEIEAKPAMQNENIRFKLQNFASSELHNIPVSVKVDDELVYSTTVAELKPFEDKVFTLPHNFSSAEARKFKVVVHAEVEGDAVHDNNEASFEVYNMGDGIVMPELSYYYYFGSRYPIVPYVSKRLSGTATFTDGRGALEAYNTYEEAVLQILPTKPNAVIQVTFWEHALNEDDILYVCTENVPDNLNVGPSDANYQITAETDKEPQTFISEAQNGGLTFYFKCKSGKVNDGWKAELREVELPDRWELKEIKEIPSGSEDILNLEVTVKNLLPVVFKKVPLYLTINGQQGEYQIPRLLANQETKYIVRRNMNHSAPMRAEVFAELARDGNSANNFMNYSIVHDPIWNGGGAIEEPATLFISEFVQVNEQNIITLPSTKYIDYRTRTTIPFYTGTENRFTFTLDKEPTAAQAANAAIRLFIDNDDDGTLREVEPELYKVALVAAKKQYELSVNLATASSVKPGKHRMRLLLANDANYAKFKQGEQIAWGHAIDFTAEIIAGASPLEHEIAILAVEGVSSGRKALTSTTPLKVKLKNNGLVKVTNVELTIQVDQKPDVKETVTVDLDAQSAEVIVPLNHTVDLSEEGTHTITVSLAPDGDNSNNSVTLSVTKMPKISDERYSLVFKNVFREKILLPGVGTTVQDEVTLEGWWKTYYPQTCTFADGGNTAIHIGSFIGGKQYVANALTIFAGKAGFISKKGVLTPNKWHHIAVVAKQVGKVTTPRAYVDGEEVELIALSDDGFKITDMELNYELAGENLMFRMWNTQRTLDQIKADMKKSVRTGATRDLPAGCITELFYTEGMGKYTSYGDELIATIVSDREDAELWKKFDPKTFSNIEVEGQILPVTFNEDKTEAVATMPFDFTAFDNVKVKFVPEDWLGVDIKQGTTTVTDDTPLDFTTDPDHKLTFDLTLDVLDVVVHHQLTLKLVKGKSNHCEMLGVTMLKSKNAGLKNDITPTTPLASFIELEAENESADQQLNPKNVVLQVTGISPNAKLYKDNEEVQPATDLTVDLSSPVILKVVAENGHNVKFYTLRLSMTQEITWDNAKISCTYGDSNLHLDAKASSKLPVTYVSENPSVVTADMQGNLITVGVGTTQIYAKQAGSDVYKPADDKKRVVEVKRLPITIKVKNVTVGLGDAIPDFEFEYDKLAFPDTEWLFEAPYVIRNEANTADAVLPLAKGNYTIVPKDYHGAYELGGYMVTRINGKLTVTEPKEAKKITFVAKDEKGLALPDVMLQCGEISASTNATGTYETYLLPDEYKVIATKTGYTSEIKTFKVTDADATVELKLLREEYTLTYTTDAHGILQGVATQHVAAGADGVQVVAVPKDIKYRFKHWSDNNSTLALRTDKNVTANITANAVFETFKYKLSYEVSEGGEFTTSEDSRKQEVEPGENGMTVTVQPKTGYIFFGWSDGVTTPSRTDMAVMTDLSVVAQFVKPYELTWTEDFNYNGANMATWSFDKTTNGAGWHIIPLSDLYKGVEDNALALAAPLEYPIPSYPLLHATSPWLSVDGHAATAKVVITFDTYIRRFYDESVATLEYCFEDDVWVNALDLDQKVGDKKTETFTIESSVLGAHKHLRFRWAFNPAGGERAYMAITNIKVAYEGTTDVRLRYYAAANGKLQKEGSTEKVAALELLASEGKKVTAVADDGYEFESWSDGLTTPDRLDNKDVMVTARFKRTLDETHVIQYVAAVNGSIIGVGYQVVEKGKKTTGVMAVPETGYAFKVWNDGNTSSYREDEVGTEDKIYTAQFAPVYTLTYRAGINGSVKGEKIQKVRSGEDGTEVEAVPNSGYHFAKWDDGYMHAKRTDKNVNAHITCKALFEANTMTYTLTYEAGEGGTIRGVTSQSVIYGGTGTEVEAVADEGYRFVKWDDENTEAKRTETNVTESKTYKAIFEAKPTTYTLTYVAGEGGTISGEATQTVAAGGTGTEVEAVANTGYKFKKWDDGLTTAKRTDANVSADKTYTAEFEKITPVEDAALASVQVAPNPFSTLLRISSDELQNATYKLLNASGVVVRSGNFESHEVTIETSDLASGLYLLHITTENGATKVVRVVKE